MKIVHFADLHLDSQFAWLGASGDVARRRREALRDALLSITALTRDIEADALFCGGDLYEQDFFTRDTGEFLKQTFAQLDPVPVYIAPGNHDWYGPESLYSQVDWSPNVHIFSTDRLASLELRDGLTLWGAAHRAPANTTGFLDGFSVTGTGVHVALFHGAERSWLTEQGESKEPHAPFEASQIVDAGLHHAFLGHYHRPRDGERHTYPGNPEPLSFGEDGLRGAVVATIDVAGRISRERTPVSTTSVHDLVLDVSGCTTRQQIREALEALAAGRGGFVRLTVVGELNPTVEVVEDDLRAAIPEFDGVQIHIGAVQTAYDIEALRHEQTVRGRFVTDVLDAGLASDEERRVLTMGLRALEGRSDLEVL
jgi:exonuclease SbcD